MRTVSLALVCSLVAFAASPAPAAQRACPSGFEVAGVDTLPRGAGRVVQASRNGQCTFDVRVCANMGAPACVERSVTRMTVRGPTAVEPPAELGDGESCGSWTTVTLRQSGGAVSRTRFGVRARGERGRRQFARLSLLCTPPEDDPPPPPPTDGSCEGIPIPPRIPGRLIDFPPSLPIASCTDGGTSSNYTTPPDLVPAATSELHIIGLYEGPRPTPGEPGEGLRPAPTPPPVVVTVHPRPKPVMLFLSAYDSVRWQVAVDPAATLERVIVQGYARQTVEGVPQGVPITELLREQSLGTFYGWELASGGGEYVRAVARIREHTGLTESSFQGCYAGSSFEIPHEPDGARPCVRNAVAGDETLPRRSVAFPGCESVTAESQYCLTTAGGGLALLGIDSGAVCPVAAGASVWLTPADPALTWRGEVAYVCDYAAGLVRVSLRDGTSEAAQMPCGGVAADGGRLFVAAPSGGEYYPYPYWQSLYGFSTWEQVIGGEFLSSLDLSFFGASRLTVHDGIVYTAWHSTNMIERYSLATGEELAPLTLEGYDGWILGLAVTGDGRLLIPGDIWGDTVYVFDVRTGKSEGIVRPTTSVIGLACVDRR